MEREDLESVLEDVLYLVEHRDDSKVRTILLTARPADAADIIRSLPEESGKAAFDLLDAHQAADIFRELDDFTRDRLAAQIGDERLSELVDVLDSDDAADVVSELPAEVAESVLRAIPAQDQAEVLELLRHGGETAGGLMQLELVRVEEGETVDEAIREVRRHAGRIEHIYNVYAVDGAGLLAGVISLDRLVTAPGDVRVGDLMERDVVKARADVDQEEVAHLFKRYNLVALPVVDGAGRLVGRITVDDIMDVLVDEASEDIRRLAGVGEEEYREPSALRITRARLPWLLIGLAGGIASAILLSTFEGPLARRIELAFFVPVVMAMGGSIGIQSSAVVIRGLATGEIGLRDTGRRVAKEVRVGFLNAGVCALLLAAVAVFWQGHEVAFVVSSALVGVIMIATIVGTTVPLLLHRLGMDPSLATGPLITTSNDLIGLSVYMTIAILYG